ncbi:MAG TPA: hypothetical protein VL485_06825 [Ktedonobacteraceae bacterium]|jgi:hypothetical protein|nr:hypothetical protein [Ktedonobacteraceae bacterium]
MMNNTLMPDRENSAISTRGWSAGEVVEIEDTGGKGFFQWWYHLTAIPEPPSTASFLKREAARRSRMVSIVCFSFIITMLFCLPASFFIPNRITIFTTSMMLVIPIISLIFNRFQQQLLAGILLVVALQLAIMLVVLTTTPLDEVSLPIYDLLTMTELLAVSLLPVRSVFFVGSINCIFISTSLIIQPHTTALAADLATQAVAIHIKPIALQILVAAISYLWVTSAHRAAIRADRAEMVANLEHALGEQKRRLEEGVEQILQTHVAIANGNLGARAPLTQDTMLWQIARALNTLLVRFQRASMAEKELRHIQQAITDTTQSIQQAEERHQQPSLIMTQSALDSLIVTLHGKTIIGVQPSAQLMYPADQPQKTPLSYPQNIFGENGQ